jgi:hypothetical protein
VSNSIPPSQEVWDHAFTASNEFEPTAGMLGTVRVFGCATTDLHQRHGILSLVHTRAELIEFIRNCMAWWNPAPSSMQPAEIAGQVQAIVEAESGDLNTMVSRLNEAMRNMWQIDWCGQLPRVVRRRRGIPAQDARIVLGR